jgi:diphthine synthase
MTFYLIGLGLNERSLSMEAAEICKKASKVYLENYTVDFPYDTKKLEQEIKVKIESLNREAVEGEKFVNDAKKKDIVLLVYGSPLAATTHISLILKCKEAEIKYRILQNASIMDAIAETGLQLYKFGKTASMPAWKKSFEPDSFLDILRENLSIKAHTLLLVDISLNSREALEQLKKSSEKKEINLDKIIIFSKAGTEESKIYYDTLENLQKKKIEFPFCIIIPTEMHFIEQEALEQLKE